MKVNRYSHHMPSGIQMKKPRLGEWRFSLTDVVIILAMAMAMAGLTGLGAIMIIEVIESLMR